MSKEFWKIIAGILMFFVLCWFFLISPVTKYQREITKVNEPWNDSISKIVSCRCAGLIGKPIYLSDGEEVQKCLGIAFFCDKYFLN